MTEKPINPKAHIASLAAALNWVHRTSDDPKLRKTVKQVLRWHMKIQAEERAEESR